MLLLFSHQGVATREVLLDDGVRCLGQLSSDDLGPVVVGDGCHGCLVDPSLTDSDGFVPRLSKVCNWRNKGIAVQLFVCGWRGRKAGYVSLLCDH